MSEIIPPGGEVLSVRFVKSESGKGAVALCKIAGGPEFVLQYFNVMVHTDEPEPGNLTFSRNKAAMKKYGRMGFRGEILPKPSHEPE